MIYPFRVSDVIRNNKNCELYEEEHNCNCYECPVNEETFICDTCNKRYYKDPYFTYFIKTPSTFIFESYLQNKYNVNLSKSEKNICSEQCMDNDTKLIKKYVTDENIQQFIKKHKETYYGRYQIFLNYLYENNIQYKDYIAIENKAKPYLEKYLNFANKGAKKELFKIIDKNCEVLNMRHIQGGPCDFVCNRCLSGFNGSPYKESFCSQACEKEFDLF